MEVSWMITGVRKDAFASSEPFEIEYDKESEDYGLYQNPELFGYGIEKSVDYKHHQAFKENSESMK